MASIPAQLCRSYRSMDISGNASVIAGDNQCTTILIEKSTLNLFCSDFCRDSGNAQLEAKLRRTVSSIPFRSSVGTISSRTSHDAVGPVQQHDSFWRWETSPEEPKYDARCRERTRRVTTSSPLAPRSDTGFLTAEDRRRIDLKTFAVKPNLGSIAGQKETTAIHTGKHSLVADERITSSNARGDPDLKSIDDHDCQIMSTILHTQPEEEFLVTFQDDLTKPCTFARDKNQPRVFFLRRNGSSWSNTTCTEIHMPRSEVDNRVRYGTTNRRRRKPRPERLLKDLGSQGERVLGHMLQEVNRCDPSGFEWHIVAIDNEYPADTRKTGEITAFIVVLSRHISTCA